MVSRDVEVEGLEDKFLSFIIMIFGVVLDFRVDLGVVEIVLDFVWEVWGMLFYSFFVLELVR